MKKHRLLLFVALLAGLPCLYGATPDSLTLKVARAIALATGIDGHIDPGASFDSLLELAGQGHPMAMNALGRLYVEGTGCAVPVMPVTTPPGITWAPSTNTDVRAFSRISPCRFIILTR